jgi:hypothetical protein
LKRSDVKTRLRRDLTAQASEVVPDRERAWSRMMTAAETQPTPPETEVMMTTETAEATNSSKRSLVLVAAAVLAVALTVALLDDSGDETTELGPAADGPHQTTEVSHISRMIDAFNEADMDRWRTHFAPGAGVFGASLDLESNNDYYAGFMALEHQLEITGDCASLVDATPRVRVRCPMRQSDTFHASGGLEISDTVMFSFEEGRIADMSFDTVSTTRSRTFFTVYMQMDVDFRLWLDDAHPGVAAVLGRTETSLTESGGILVRYVDEFVAQSDRYPVE